uniref:Uncharacterized protein n=1 Tax=Clytia hemisphaerica TaxID=252671 RepID=A0A7M6DPV4_9CNID|eukprot:TCONS_00038096-protein
MALSEASMLKAKETYILKVRPIDHEFIFTWFWVDNFDVLVEKDGGGGSVNTTHLVAFQEPGLRGANKDIHVEIPRTRKRKLCIPTEKEHVAYIVDTAAPPPAINTTSHNESFSEMDFNNSMFTWIFFRNVNHSDQAVPIFTGWRLFGSKPRPQNFQKTVETYLPPITTKVTEFTTISKYMSYL